MSARAPFFASSGRQQESMENGGQPEPQFPADKSNPLRPDVPADIDPSPKKQEKSAPHVADNKRSTESDANGAQNKPFNVSGLIRSRTHSKPPQRIPVGSVNGNNIARPGTADPTRGIQPFDTHTVTIAAPTPFKASRMAPSLLLNTSNPDISPRGTPPFNFKAPALPPMHLDDDSVANDVHIPTETRHPSHTADVSSHSRTVNGLGNRSAPSRALDCDEIEVVAHRTNGFGPQHGLNGIKRRKHESEINGPSSLAQHQKHSKRFKEGHMARNNTGVEGNVQERAHPRRAEQVPYRYPAIPSRGSGEIGAGADGDSTTYPNAENVKTDEQDHVGVLDRLLGRDVNAFVEERTEKYEQSVIRWRESTLEEWVAGADEVMSKYTKILDVAKDHLTAKIALYASCTKRIEQHGSVLTEREELLSGVQTRLVKESECILGRSLGV